MSIFLQTLSQANAVCVKQQIELGEMLGYGQKFEISEIFGFKTCSTYQIQTDDGQQFGYCAEPNLDFGDAIKRQFLGRYRVFNIVGTDMKNQRVFRIYHPFRWFLQRLDVFGAGDRPVGSLQQRFAWFNNKFEFLDTRGRVVMTLTLSHRKYWKYWKSSIKKGEREVSVIEKTEKKWSGFSDFFTDPDHFRVRFIDTRLTADEKLLLFAGAVFVDLLYFETKPSSY
jgi:hypothetical protein